MRTATVSRVARTSESRHLYVADHGAGTSANRTFYGGRPEEDAKPHDEASFERLGLMQFNQLIDWMNFFDQSSKEQKCLLIKVRF